MRRYDNDRIGWQIVIEYDNKAVRVNKDYCCTNQHLSCSGTSLQLSMVA